jgi:hypothetical protein
MNLNPEAIDNFEVDAWSDSDAGGIDLTVTETNEATGIFEGTGCSAHREVCREEVSRINPRITGRKGRRG